MLFHLPIVLLTTLSPIPVSDGVPTLDVAKECRFEGGSSEVFDRCMRDENEARTEVEALRPKVSSEDRTACVSEATVGGYASYIELITCLEMARDVAALENRSADPPAGAESRPSDQATGARRDR
jgi:hypothetical protein